MDSSSIKGHRCDIRIRGCQMQLERMWMWLLRMRSRRLGLNEFIWVPACHGERHRIWDWTERGHGGARSDAATTTGDGESFRRSFRLGRQVRVHCLEHLVFISFTLAVLGVQLQQSRIYGFTPRSFPHHQSLAHLLKQIFVVVVVVFPGQFILLHRRIQTLCLFQVRLF